MTITEQLTHSVAIVWRTADIRVPCDSDGPLVVAALPGGAFMSITHRRTGLSVGRGARFETTQAGLSAAQSFRDELLALPMDWASSQPDPVAADCVAALQDIHDRANAWTDKTEPTP